MLGPLPLIGFVPTIDLERSRKFYVETLGFQFESQGPYSVVLQNGSNVIQLVKVEEHAPSSFTILGWETPDIEKTVRGLIAAGVKIERYEFFEHDELGIWHSPEGTSKIAWFKDPDENTLLVSQHG